MLTFLTIFFPAVMLVGVLALERMERQLGEQTLVARDVGVHSAAPPDVA
jgi:hypothetical protein